MWYVRLTVTHIKPLITGTPVKIIIIYIYIYIYILCDYELGLRMWIISCQEYFYLR